MWCLSRRLNWSAYCENVRESRLLTVPKGEEPSSVGQPEQSEETEAHEPQGPIRLPFDSTRRTPELAPSPEPRATHEPSSDQDRPPFLAAPTAPDDLMEAPLPRKEILGKKPAPTIPGLLEAAPVKEAQKPLPLKAQEGLSVAGPEERIPLGTRGEPEVIPRVTTGRPPFEVPKKKLQLWFGRGKKRKRLPRSS